MKARVVLISCFFMAFLARPFAFQDEHESIHTLYSSSSSQSPLAINLTYEYILEKWSEVLDKKDDLSGPHDRFKTEIKTLGNTLYLELTDQITQESFLHFPQENHSMEMKKLVKDFTRYEIDPSTFRKQSLLDKITEISEYEISTEWDVWEKGSRETLEEIFEVYKEVKVQWAIKALEAMTENKDFLKEYVDKNEVKAHIEGLGKGELNSIDGNLFIRVVHEKTEVSFAIGSKGLFDFKSKHFQQYVSRQHILSGEHRGDGQKGRDFIFLEVNNLEDDLHPELKDPTRFTKFEREECLKKGLLKRMGCKKFWKKYKLAIVKEMNFVDTVFGFVCGIIQGAFIMASTAGLNYYAGTDMNVINPAILTVVWATVFGTIAPTFKNWENASSHYIFRIFKNMSNGVAYQIIITGLIFHNMPELLDITTISGMINYARIFTGSFISNYAKTNWNYIPNLREKIGVNKGNFYLFGHETELKRTQYERQLYYMNAFVFRYIDRVNFSRPPEQPFGMLALLLSIGLSEKFALWKAKKMLLDYPEDTEKTQRVINEIKRRRKIRKLMLNKKFFSLLAKNVYYKFRDNPHKQNEILRQMIDLWPHLYNEKMLKIDVSEHEIKKFEIPDVFEKPDQTCLKIMNQFIRLQKKKEVAF